MLHCQPTVSWRHINDNGLQIVDISDPASPIMRGEYNDGPQGVFSDIGVVLNSGETHAVLSSGDIIDIASDPDNPSKVGDLPSDWFYAEVVGNYLFAADGNLSVYDLSDPTAPVLHGGLAIGAQQASVLLVTLRILLEQMVLLPLMFQSSNSNSALSSQ